MVTAVQRPAIAVRKIRQKDGFVFSIEWTDGLLQDFRLSDLQRNCPCANCVDEETGLRRLKPDQVPDDVSATKVKNVGRYALRVDFTRGCSAGIYTFDLLRQIGVVEQTP